MELEYEKYFDSLADGEEAMSFEEFKECMK